MSQVACYRPMHKRKLGKNSHQNHDERKDLGRGNEFIRPVSLMQQIIALVRKNLINKLRTPLGTILELFSPAVFILILVLGYDLGEKNRTFASAQKYVDWEFDLPNEAFSTVLSGIRDESSSNGIGSSDGLGKFHVRRNLLRDKAHISNNLFHEEESRENHLNDNIVDDSNHDMFRKFAIRALHAAGPTIKMSSLQLFQDEVSEFLYLYVRIYLSFE